MKLLIGKRACLAAFGNIPEDATVWPFGEISDNKGFDTAIEIEVSDDVERCWYRRSADVPFKSLTHTTAVHLEIAIWLCRMDDNSELRVSVVS